VRDEDTKGIIPHWEKHPALRIFENIALRSIPGPEKEEIMGGWRQLHNEELRNLYTSPHITRRVKLKKDGMGSTYSKHESDENCIQDSNRKTCREKTTLNTQVKVGEYY
jgi:hypothetical protein